MPPGDILSLAEALRASDKDDTEESRARKKKYQKYWRAIHPPADPKRSGRNRAPGSVLAAIADGKNLWSLYETHDGDWRKIEIEFKEESQKEFENSRKQGAMTRLQLVDFYKSESVADEIIATLRAAKKKSRHPEIPDNDDAILWHAWAGASRTYKEVRRSTQAATATAEVDVDDVSKGGSESVLKMFQTLPPTMGAQGSLLALPAESEAMDVDCGMGDNGKNGKPEAKVTAKAKGKAKPKAAPKEKTPLQIKKEEARKKLAVVKGNKTRVEGWLTTLATSAWEDNQTLVTLLQDYEGEIKKHVLDLQAAVDWTKDCRATSADAAATTTTNTTTTSTSTTTTTPTTTTTTTTTTLLVLQLQQQHCYYYQQQHQQQQQQQQP